ncbi:MAG: hypothetical protein ABIJ15_00275 [bacterium]
MAIGLLKSEYVGIRELRENISRFFSKDKPLIVTDHGSPKKIIISFSDMVELLEIMDEISDPETIAAVMKARGSITAGSKGIPVSKLFKKIRNRRK